MQRFRGGLVFKAHRLLYHFLCLRVSNKEEGKEAPSLRRLWEATRAQESARWSTRVSLAQYFERNVTKFAPHKARNLIASCKLTFDERVVLHRVDAPYSILSSVSVHEGCCATADNPSPRCWRSSSRGGHVASLASLLRFAHEPQSRQPSLLLYQPQPS